jgi:hypothetical protein
MSSSERTQRRRIDRAFGLDAVGMKGSDESGIPIYRLASQAIDQSPIASTTFGAQNRRA